MKKYFKIHIDGFGYENEIVKVMLAADGYGNGTYPGCGDGYHHHYCDNGHGSFRGSLGEGYGCGDCSSVDHDGNGIGHSPHESTIKISDW